MRKGGAYRFPAARVLAAASAAAAWNDKKTTAMHSVKLTLFCVWPDIVVLQESD